MPKCIACGKEVTKNDVYCFVGIFNNVFHLHLECFVEMLVLYKRYVKWSD